MKCVIGGGKLKYEIAHWTNTCLFLPRCKMCNMLYFSASYIILNVIESVFCTHISYQDKYISIYIHFRHFCEGSGGMGGK